MIAQERVDLAVYAEVWAMVGQLVLKEVLQQRWLRAVWGIGDTVENELEKGTSHAS